MKKLLTVIGARPQFIKASILSKKIGGEFEEILLHTGQHYDANMSDIFFQELVIDKPKYNLDVGSLSHASQTARMMEGIEKIIENELPDGVLVYGDTNSTLAGALTASKMQIPLFHVEGGIRTYCSYMPEEQNRIVTDHLSNLIFVSTQDNLKQACKEGLADRSYLVGDIMYDSLLHYSELVRSNNKENYRGKLKGIFDSKLIGENFYLATIHRPENTDNENNFKEILDALNKLECQVVLSTHPRIRDKVLRMGKKYLNIFFVEPLSYLETIYFTSSAKMVVTDSGGLHKEAYLLGTPCVTILKSGWKETTKGGWNQFVSPSSNDIIKAVIHKKVDRAVNRNEFGDGNACQKIVDLMKEYFNNISNNVCLSKD